MTEQKSFVPFTQSKTPAERIAYVKANPGKYMSLPLKNKLDEIAAKQAEQDKKMDLILSKLSK
tara:strand:- start:119 stop:307 length:189 start_codon:yes stop_codon:yes gene_type:complete